MVWTGLPLRLNIFLAAYLIAPKWEEEGMVFFYCLDDVRFFVSCFRTHNTQSISSFCSCCGGCSSYFGHSYSLYTCTSTHDYTMSRHRSSVKQKVYAVFVSRSLQQHAKALSFCLTSSVFFFFCIILYYSILDFYCELNSQTNLW